MTPAGTQREAVSASAEAASVMPAAGAVRPPQAPAVLGECLWPTCDHRAVLREPDGQQWCWCHVDTGTPAVSGKLRTCRHCGRGTVWHIQDLPMHPSCWRPYLMERVS